MITLVLGGTRSGKSLVAETMAATAASTGTEGPVTYVATAAVDPSDRGHVARIAAHRQRRPAEWSTVECGPGDDLPEIMGGLRGVVLVDSLGTWVAGHPSMTPPVDDLCRALLARHDPTIIVSEEVGLSVHAPSAAGRAFTDALGAANQAVSAVCTAAYLVVAGRPLQLPPPIT